MDKQDSLQGVGQEQAEWDWVRKECGRECISSWAGHSFLVSPLCPSWKATNIMTLSCFSLRFQPYPARQLTPLVESADF